MKVAICSVGELFGGVERHILGMSSWLTREGHEFILILFHDRELAKQAREIGVEPIILMTRGRFDLRGPDRLARILEDHQVEVVHAHGYRAVVNCALAKRKYNFGMVRTVHGLVESEGWWTRAGLKGQFYSWLERYFGRRVGAGVAYVTKDLMLRHIQFDQGLETQTIHNGIDPLSPEEYSRPGDLEAGIFHLGAVGRVSRVKGLEHVIRAVATLDSGKKVVLNIIGTGPQQRELKELTSELQSEDRVRFLAFKKNIYSYIANVDVLVMPSLHEGLPYTILEALSLGTPIIASRVGGLGEILEGKSSAQLLEVGDVSGLRDSIEAHWENWKNPDKSCVQVENHNDIELSLEYMGKRYWAFYEDVEKGA